MAQTTSFLSLPRPATSKLLRWPRPGFLYALSMVMGMSGGAALNNLVSDFAVPRNATGSFRLMAQAYNTIQRHYVDRPALQPASLAYGAINGMVDALGDTGHSTFLTPDMVKEVKNFQQGRLKGIGAEVQAKAGNIVVIAPIDGSPAQAAGLQAGDIIFKVNGQDISGLPLSQAVNRIMGPPGSSVNLSILDPHSGRAREVKIKRAAIKLHSVTWARLPETSVVHVRIADFEEGTTKELAKVLKAIKAQGMTGIILDIRNNPGGILDEAVGVASQFLKGGNVLLVKNADGKISPMPVERDGDPTDTPMVVLVNNGSASGAEIVAGALQDAHRATLVGERTFGTGTVLKEFPLADGSAVLLAVEEWLTPGGQSFWHQGLAPQITVALSPDLNPLRPESERNLTYDELQTSRDNQLLRALELLQRTNATASR